MSAFDTPDWTIPPVEDFPDDDGYYLMLEVCDDDCHHPVHAFHPERRKHFIEADLVEIARKNDWFE